MGETWEGTDRHGTIERAAFRTSVLLLVLAVLLIAGAFLVGYAAPSGAW